MNLAQNLKKLRLAHGLSQKEFGAIVDVSDKAVSTWEKGTKEPRISTLLVLAEHFGVDIGVLITGDVSECLEKNKEG